MKFVNYKLLLNPAFAIGVKYNGVEYDLHNFADFDGFRYSVDSSTAELIWRLTRYEDVDRIGGSWLCLAFRGAYYFEVRPRDAEMPLGEDTCLDSISFIGADQDLQNLPYDEIPCLIRGRDNIDTSSHLLFRFHGGQRIRIGSEATQFTMVLNPAERQRVRDEIARAFASTVYPGDELLVTFNPEVDPDTDDVLERLQGKSWQDVLSKLDQIEGPDLYHYSAVYGWLTPESFCYYLPAFLSMSLDLSRADVAGTDLLYFLDPRHTIGELARLLSADQKQAVSAAIDYIFQEYPGPEFQHTKPYWDRLAAGHGGSG